MSKGAQKIAPNLNTHSEASRLTVTTHRPQSQTQIWPLCGVINTNKTLKTTKKERFLKEKAQCSF